MSLDKAISSGKEHRKQYFGTKAVDSSCRCHGSCPWCQGAREHKYKRKEKIYTKEEIDIPVKV